MKVYEVKGLTFVQTCICCPEQYDVMDSRNNLVGYVRLRYGHLSCSYPDVKGEYVYLESVGSDMTGIFVDEEQRMYYLDKIADSILKKIGG